MIVPVAFERGVQAGGAARHDDRGREVSYRLDRTLAQLERFVNEMLITKLPPIRNDQRETG